MTEVNGGTTYSNIKHTILVLSGKGGKEIIRFKLISRGRKVIDNVATGADIVHERIPSRRSRH
jgi:hypothetical protein